MGILDFLKSTVERLGAARTVSELKKTLEAERLIKSLKDEVAYLRCEAAEALGKIGEPAVEPLLRALKDEDRNVRGSVAGILGTIGGKQAIEALIQALEDEDPNVRERAARALGNTENEFSVESHIQALKDRESAVEPLIRASRDKNSSVQKSAAEALKRIGWKPLLAVEAAIKTDRSLEATPTFSDLSHLPLVKGWRLTLDEDPSADDKVRFAVRCAGCGLELPESGVIWRPARRMAGPTIDCVSCGYQLDPILLDLGSRKVIIGLFLRAGTPGNIVRLAKDSFKITGLGEKKRTSPEGSPVAFPGGIPPWALVDRNGGSRKALEISAMLRSGNFSALTPSDHTRCSSCGCAIATFSPSNAEAKEIAAGRKSAHPRLARHCQKCDQSFCNACVWLAGHEKHSPEILYGWHEACPQCDHTYLD